MTYEKQTWNKYDDLKTEEENIQNGAVVTDNRMNHMEEGISTIDLEITSHESNKTNPHSVTKEQVGLSNVSNYGIATEAEAIAGTSNAKYMTPSLTKKAAKSYVDKTDVGLSNVDNVKQASKSEFDDHTANKTNPHGVTAAQVGAYTKSETDAKFKTVNDLIISQDIPEGANLDDYKKEGEFSKKTPTVVTGVPEGVTGAFRLSVRSMVGSSGIFQTLYDYATRGIYYRVGNTSLGFNLPWQRIANNSEVVHLTGDETIEGKKTFSDDTIFKGDVAWTDINLSSQFTGGQPQVMVDRGKWLVVYLNDIKTATTLAANTPVNIIQLPVNMRTDRQQEKTVNIRIASEFVSCRLLLMSTGYIAVVPPKSIPSGSGFGITETFILI
ncbi:pyocin knob domain-containing protein [Lactococcus petauri]|uniref:Pyocin knob domain-containing protein n=1 Tax=Lactococcus petauri TaxID=1940789 RepID=A0AAJ2IUN9_9LACT|nr:pyocin knob domain-containing protein [Lactococcus petauri]MDT2583573.1 pyocin knob domain-containing protein [Lactococcus petauri]